MSFIAVAIGGAAAIGAVGSIAGGVIQGNAAGSAAQTQAQAAQSASNVQQQEFQQQQQNLQPWLQAGSSALGQMGQMTAAGPPQFTQAQFLANQDPAYGFDLGQGELAMQRSAAAAGGLQNTGTLKNLNNYAQGQASNEYQNAYSRFMNSQNTQFNRLASMAGMGQTANGQLGQQGMNMANNVGQNMMGAGNAQAAGMIGGANAMASGINGVGSSLGGMANNYLTYQAMQPPAQAGSISSLGATNYGPGGGYGSGAGVAMAGQPYASPDASLIG